MKSYKTIIGANGTCVLKDGKRLSDESYNSLTGGGRPLAVIPGNWPNIFQSNPQYLLNQADLGFRNARPLKEKGEEHLAKKHSREAEALRLAANEIIQMRALILDHFGE